MKKFKNYLLIGLVGTSMVFTSCGDDDAPDVENDPEIITDVTLVFTNSADATDVVRASAQDPDGLGAQELQVNDEITLSANTTYVLTYEILNALDPDDVENIGEDDIAVEDDEHQVFYSFTADAFSDPAGNGNIDNAADAINYNDFDDNQNPLGLNTTWTTGSALTGGSFVARLQHQPDEKTSTSGATTGDTDFNLTFVLNIE